MRAALGVVALALVVSACTQGAEPATTSTSVAEATTTTPVPAPAETRWIEVSGDGFVDTRTGEAFVPVGVNLLMKVGGGGGDVMFADYDPAWVEAQLEAIAGHGFNTVRFFLDMCMTCTTSATGILPDYLDALADLLTRLESHGLVALPTSNDVPDPGYSDRLPCCEPFGGYRNSLYLSPEGHEIAVEYWTDLIGGLKERGAPTHHVLGWQLANEQFVLRDVAPISLTTGTVVTADGVEYDLSDDAAVAEMVVSNLRVYVTTVGDVVRELDGGALVTMGFFSADEPGAGRVAADNRWVVPDEILGESTLDFVDLHAYPGFGGTWDGIAAAYGLTGEPLGYPLLLGEFGAFEAAFPEPAEGAAAMARWQAESCELGFGGWLLWFWGAEEDDEVITADSHDAVVARAISPLTRPDPCDVGPYASANLALGRSATASAEESDDYAAGYVTDGSDATWWSAGAGPPQWVEVDLGSAQTIGRVEILIGHVSAPGPQTHLVTARGPGESGPVTLLGEVSADAAQGDVLVVEFAPMAGVQTVRVETTAVDGWVILHEVRVFAGG